jgi:hypothetical protein
MQLYHGSSVCFDHQIPDRYDSKIVPKLPHSERFGWGRLLWRFEEAVTCDLTLPEQGESIFPAFSLSVW